MLNSFNNVIDGETKKFKEFGCRSRFAETIQTDNGTGAADVLPPTVRPAGLDGDNGSAFA